MYPVCNHSEWWSFNMSSPWWRLTDTKGENSAWHSIEKNVLESKFFRFDKFNCVFDLNHEPWKTDCESAVVTNNRITRIRRHTSHANHRKCIIEFPELAFFPSLVGFKSQNQLYLHTVVPLRLLINPFLSKCTQASVFVTDTKPGGWGEDAKVLNTIEMCCIYVHLNAGDDKQWAFSLSISLSHYKLGNSSHKEWTKVRLLYRRRNHRKRRHWSWHEIACDLLELLIQNLYLSLSVLDCAQPNDIHLDIEY